MKKALLSLSEKYGAEVIRLREPMSKHTSFKIGGPADAVCIPRNMDEGLAIIDALKTVGVPFMVMGNGSNLLVPDHGLEGAVVKINEGFKGMECVGETIVAEAGVLLSSLSNFALACGLGGLEFASGIPGTLGGAVFMNAGAYDGEMQQVVKSVTVLDKEGRVKVLDRASLSFGYRSSSIQAEGSVVLRAELQLQVSSPEVIKAFIDDLTQRRTSKQPLELASAGSVFKRPVGHYAGKLIEDAGLRGLRYGDAQVSEKHCGFIVNLGNASYNDVTTLIRTVQKIVRDTFGVALETEIRIL